MKKVLLLILLLAAPALAQEEAVIDTTWVSEEGQTIRYHGPVKGVDLQGEAKALSMRDDRVPLGYGWKSLRGWQEGDLRPEPVRGPGLIGTEFFNLHYHPTTSSAVALAFAEYTDFVYFAIKDRLGWTPAEPVDLYAAYDLPAWGREFGLVWWIPVALQGDSLVCQPISVITARGIAMESLTRVYLEHLLKQKTGDRLPEWFSFGAGAYFGGEGWILEGQLLDIGGGQLPVEIDHATMVEDLAIARDREILDLEIAAPASQEQPRRKLRRAHWRAYRLAENIIVRHGQRGFRDLVEAMEQDADLTFGNAVAQVFGQSLDELLAECRPWKASSE